MAEGLQAPNCPTCGIAREYWDKAVADGHRDLLRCGDNWHNAADITVTFPSPLHLLSVCDVLRQLDWKTEATQESEAILKTALKEVTDGSE